MAWCPKCGEEYRAGWTRCEACDADLVAARPEAPELPEKEQVQETLLTVVPDEIAFAQVESVLGRFGIPVLKKHRGSGAYLELYMGTSPFGIEVYVPFSALEAAQKALSGELEPGAAAETEAPPVLERPVTVLEQEEDRELHRYLLAVNADMQRRKRVIAVTLLISIVTGLAWTAVSLLTELIKL